MNVLILSASFGHGHTSAALSIKEKILSENSNCNVMIIDFVEYLFPKSSKVIYKCFNFMVNKCHTVYNFLNLLAPKNCGAPLKGVVVKKIEKLLNEKNVDAIISVVPMCSIYISSYKKIKRDNIMLITCITDVLVHFSWINESTDIYLVSSNFTKDFLKSKNVNEENIVISGIPVSSKYFINSNKNGKKRLLIMGGGLGLIPNSNKLLYSLNKLNYIDTTVIVGNNRKLYNKLSKKYKNIEILGFTDKVYEYMSKADLIVTKAGGITMFEAIYSGVPLFIIKPFLVQEMGNARYVESKHLGKVVWKNSRDVVNQVLSLINDYDELNLIKQNMKNVINDLDRFSYIDLILVRERELW